MGDAVLLDRAISTSPSPPGSPPTRGCGLARGPASTDTLTNVSYVTLPSLTVSAASVGLSILTRGLRAIAVLPNDVILVITVAAITSTIVITIIPTPIPTTTPHPALGWWLQPTRGRQR
jgi:hypothetical protein